MAIGTQNLPSKLSPSRELTLIFSKGNGDDSSFMSVQYTYYVKFMG
ncbi:conserved hypothetical protein [Pantoea brenneri]|uniref:Uncharacterized protein n=1 Tax=Pantoea brenneri TaxID=472694 RepID=A0AAX3JA15_9GAMM|nr:conserved hypothetical protein [Pantoea brenneri]